MGRSAFQTLHFELVKRSGTFGVAAPLVLSFFSFFENLRDLFILSPLIYVEDKTTVLVQLGLLLKGMVD